VTSPKPRETFRFQEFELDLAAYELRRQGRRVRLERRPMDLLIMMVQRRGELITRSEIAEHLWGKDVFIEVETAVNTAVRKIRHALRDSSDTPSFIETVPGKGYRFIAPVVVLAEAPAASHLSPPEVPLAAPAAIAGRIDRARIGWIAAALLALILVAAAGVWLRHAMRPEPPHIRLAVLPFETMGIEADRSYLADALHDETIAALGQVDPEHIRVITRTSMLEYRSTAKPLLQIAHELEVEYIVGSTIHIDRGRVRVMAKLTRMRDQIDIWSGSYDTEPRSTLDFQRELSVTIAREIRQTLSPERLDALARRHTANSEAFQLYLQGLHAWNQLKPPLTTRRAIDFYTRATEADRGYALPWAGLALAYAGAPINADQDPGIMGRLARDAAQRAIAADARLAEAQTAVGAVHFWFDWDWAKAEAMFRKATTTDPNYAFGRRMVGILLSHQARHDEARDHMRELLFLEPRYEMNWALSGQVAYNAGAYSEAIGFAKQALRFESNFWIANYQLAMAYERTGKSESALQALDAQLALGPPNSKLHSLRGYVLATMGRQREARDVLITLDEMSRKQYVPPYARALVHAGLDDRNAALDWLERGHRERDVHLIALAVDAKWHAYRQEPRFIALLKR